jgi:hypothetical protein
MPAKYTLTIKEGKEKNYETIDFIGSGFTNNNKKSVQLKATS